MEQPGDGTARLQPVDFILCGAGHLEQQVRPSKYFFGGIGDPRTGLFKLAVIKSKLGTRLMLHVDLVPILTQYFHRSRWQADSSFEWPSFLWNSYDHMASMKENPKGRKDP